MSEGRKVNKRFSMFFPRTKHGLLSDYPELKKIDAFKSLNIFDLKYVWYFACKASPFAYEDDAGVRSDMSVMEVYGETKGAGMKAAFAAGNYSEKVRVAITEMRKFEPGPRIKAKMMVERVMDNFSKYTNQDITKDFKDGDSEDDDQVKQKAFIDSCAKISSTLPTLIKQAEGNFGISEIDEGDEFELEAEDLIDEFHSSNN